MQKHSPEESDAAALHLRPIGRFHCEERHPYDAARQGVLSDNAGEVRLFPGHSYATALRHIEGVSHLWLLFWFDRNPLWKPLVTPPRGTRRVGVFATRSPHRPNPLGLSLVRLERVEGLSLFVRGHDLLDGTPVLDIKPYLAYADSVPNASVGWLAEAECESTWAVSFAPEAESALAFLAEQGLPMLGGFLRRELAWRPTDATRKRVRDCGGGRWEIAYRTWRADYEVDSASLAVHVVGIRSGYTAQELADGQPDRYGDKALHRLFHTSRGVEQPGWRMG